ncbi:galactosylceramide sulfotransferase-like isoform X2 [Artemia franciscana]|uniref:Uncharacterized protein n=1 Tax=Artemia franciscana TaxID=6661 RepID=A0AA88LHD7_ARTSF|nr:hypothetical protein QYM36_007776 [Artemia franciscana]
MLENNIVFVKSYKVAGTSMTQIMLRLAWLYSRIIDMETKSDFFRFEMYQDLLASRQIHFDILVQETWNKTWVTNLELENAVHITCLRDPVDAFESLFHYVDMTQFYNVSSFSEFVLKCNSTDGPRSERMKGLWGRNQLSYSLGLPEEHFDNIKMIEKFSKEIEEQFDLVMITEYFEESLIFLKNILSVPLMHVLSTKSNARHENSKHIITNKERDILSNWLKADIYLYQQFRRKFEMKMKSRIKKEAKILRKFNELLYKSCNVYQDNLSFSKIRRKKAKLSEPLPSRIYFVTTSS